MGGLPTSDEMSAEMDRIIETVMPDTWLGHARLTIHQSDLSDEQREFAMRLTEKLSEKYNSQPTDKLAEKAIEKANEKF